MNDEHGVKPDKEAPQHRKNGPAPDEEAYAPDKEAVQHRNIRPAPDKDEPVHCDNRPAYDEEAVVIRNNRPKGREYGYYRCKSLKEDGILPIRIKMAVPGMRKAG